MSLLGCERGVSDERGENEFVYPRSVKQRWGSLQPFRREGMAELGNWWRIWQVNESLPTEYKESELFSDGGAFSGEWGLFYFDRRGWK